MRNPPKHLDSNPAVRLLWQPRPPPRNTPSGYAAKAYELGSPVPLKVVLYPVFVRAQAFLMQRNGSAAAAEFQEILDHPGLLGNSTLGPLSQLGLAHAYAISGDAGKARAAYAGFLNVWKDADADIPVLREAKTEYSRLQ